MKKVYYGNKIILFTTESHKFDKKHGISFVSIKNIQQLKEQINLLTKNENPKTTAFLFKRKKKLKKIIKKFFVHIDAAGGLVKNEKNQYLIIERSGKWDLAKGKIEKNEKPKKAAIREVNEETMISPLKIEKKLCNTYHIYEHNERLVLKKTFWYAMKANSSSKLKPQLEEDITQVIWMSGNELQKVYDNTYRSLLEVFNAAKLKLISKY